MLEKIAEFQIEIAQLPKKQKERRKEEQFYLLLDMVPSLIDHAYVDQLKTCEVQKVESLKAYLLKMGIKDKETLFENIRYNYQCGNQYEQFMTFWAGEPCFNLEQCQPKSKEYFLFCKDYAQQFQPYVGKMGFYAWDVSESIHRIREAYTCGYLSEAETRAEIQTYVGLARHVFHNFEEYAVSYICGSMYYMMRESRNEEYVKQIEETMLKLCRHLFFDEKDNVWSRISWIAETIYFSDLEEIRDMGLTMGSFGCFVTDRISVERKAITYFYREEPMEQYPDSGWRFFAGDEDDAYLDDLSHTHIFSLNTVVNAFPLLAKYMDEPIGSAFAIGKDGTYHKVIKE